MALSLIEGWADPRSRRRNRRHGSAVGRQAPYPSTSRRWGNLMHTVFYVIGVVVVVLIVLRLAGFA
jgi:hypothetical protein